MLKKVWNVATTILVIVMVVLAILLVGVRLVGVQPYAVLSGSMSPAYPVGALIYVKPTEAQEVRVGDAITFHLDNTTMVATHRVIRIDAENSCFYTKGDANEAADGQPVYFDRLIGIPAFSIPVLGYIANAITTPPGLFIAILTAVVILAMTFLPGLVTKAGKQGGCDEEGIAEDSKADSQKHRRGARAAVKRELTVK